MGLMEELGYEPVIFVKDCDVNKNLTKGNGMNDNGKIQCSSAKSNPTPNVKVHNVLCRWIQPQRRFDNGHKCTSFK